MITTIINDCRDANAVGRQIARASLLLKSPVNFIGVASELEASGNIIDILDATEGQENVILVNVAPRNGQAKKWKNGTPFGYFWYKQTLVVTSVDGITLSLVKKLNLTDSVNVLDLPTVVDILIKEGYLTSDLKNYIANTQFRSYDFLPRVGAYLFKNKNIESVATPMADFAEAPQAVWFVDNFGNCKTTLLPEEIKLSEDKKVITRFGELDLFTRLADVPEKTTALVIGSSGLGHHRFLEVMSQGADTAKKLNLASGDLII